MQDSAGGDSDKGDDQQSAGAAADPFVCVYLPGRTAGSFSILIGIAAQRLPAEKRSLVSGFINAGGSLGQFVFAPLVQYIIGVAGWAGAMFATTFAALLTIPLVVPLMRGHSTAAAISTVAAVPHLSLGEQLRVALRDPSYLCLHAGFF